jgi:hypothetical protein
VITMPSGTLETTTVEFKHLEPGKEIAVGIAGYYVMFKEVILPYKGREVIYLTGKAVIEASCCGSGSWVYASVPGYIVGWHTGEKEGSATSEVEPISSPVEREELNKIIQGKEELEIVYFP